ncbi:MAG: type II toxin-antitoxin system VapC family toxin [Sulfuricellaceae bacterium]|nr:type II toxin-antitoxin system VapC family toxin [Sulfuricellaceae bacterium]
MIVADTNLVAYLLLEGPMLDLAEQVYRKDPDWVAPALWRCEFRNVLAGLMRRNRLDFSGALAYWNEADSLLGVPDELPDGAEILRLAQASGCTAYDCEFVALAQKRAIPLVTADSQVLRAFPGTAFSPQDFLGGQ